MSIKFKLIAGFITVAMIAALIGLISMTNLNAMARSAEHMYMNQTMPLGQLVYITENFQRQRINIRDLVQAQSDTDVRAIEATLTQLDQQVERAYAAYQSTLLPGRGQDLFNLALAARSEFRASFQQQMDLARAGRNQDAIDLIDGQGRVAALAYQAALNDLVSFKMDNAEAEYQQALATAAQISLTVTSIAFVGVIAALILGISIALSISNPLGVAVKLLGQMAQGDLRTRVPPKFLKRGDEIGTLAKALDLFADELRRIVSGILAASQQVAAGSEQISSSAQQLSQGSTEQAANAEEVSSSVEEMSATVKQNADNSQATESIARKSAIDADQGGQAVSQSVEAMKEIATRISIIDEIARQTNLLALNAAIEAARAGEAGKGFAVVASEVRKLAERSQKAAGEIGDLSNKTVSSATNAGSIIQSIIPDIRKTSDLVMEIASASTEQSSGIDQIAKAITQLDTVIQQNASASEELASMAEELSGQSEQLSQTIAFFRIDDALSPIAQLLPVKKTMAPSTTPNASPHRPQRTAPPSGKTAITLAKKEAITRAAVPASDSDFEEF